MSRCGRSGCACCQRVRRHAMTLSGVPVALSGPGESIGRWGPVTTWGGRTAGEPCTGLFDACTDWDLDAWLTEGKKWLQYAQMMRTNNVVYGFGDNVDTWPKEAKLGEVAYNTARDLIAGDLGYLDSTKIQTLIEAQKYAKLALEGYIQALEKDLDVKVEVDPEIVDKIVDPNETPPVIPWPSLPSLSSIFGWPLAIGGIALVLALSLGNSRRGAA